ncbi:MAG: hypothetical protein ACLTMP_13375 [Eggerthella lenta]
MLKLVGKELEKKAPLAVELGPGQRRTRSWTRPSRGETVGVAFIEPEQVSLFNAGSIAR